MQKVHCHSFYKQAPAAYMLYISVSFSKPIYLGTVSSFPHGTCTLSVIQKYLGLIGGSIIFKQVLHDPPYSKK